MRKSMRGGRAPGRSGGGCLLGRPLREVSQVFRSYRRIVLWSTGVKNGGAPRPVPKPIYLPLPLSILFNPYPSVCPKILQCGRGRYLLSPDGRDERLCQEKYRGNKWRKVVEGKDQRVGPEDLSKLWPVPFGLYGDAPPSAFQQK